MPNGYGVYRHGVVPARDRAAIASLPAAGSKNGSKLVAAANLAVRRLAKTHGLALAPAPSPASHSSSTRDRLLIAGAAAAAAALAAVVVSVRRRR